MLELTCNLFYADKNAISLLITNINILYNKLGN